MSEAHEELTAAAKAASPDATNASVPDVQFRSDLAFPRLTDEMLQRIVSYGHEETVAESTQLYTYGDRDTDMFVILNGEIESRLLVEGGRSKCFRLLSAGEFTGELNLLNTQRTVALARTTRMSRLLRISRRNLRLLMRAEGDLANIIVSACIWRRIGMMGDPSTGIVLRGKSDDPDLIKLRRFLVRNYYRIESRTSERPQATPGRPQWPPRWSSCWTAASLWSRLSAILLTSWASRRRNAKAAKRFLGKALNGLKDWEKPVLINTDKAPTYSIAISELKTEGKCPEKTVHRQVKYRNNVVEADHGKLKQLIRPVRGFKTVKTAYATIKGFEVMRAYARGKRRSSTSRKTSAARPASLNALSASVPLRSRRPSQSSVNDSNSNLLDGGIGQHLERPRQKMTFCNRAVCDP